MGNKELLMVWRAMHNRCYNNKQASYANYGARGIVVAECWQGKDGFSRFMADMGPRPKGGSIERINNDGPYAPENCKWATRSQQASNKRNNRHITAQGKTQIMAAWAREIGCSAATILLRIQAGMSEADAVTIPVQERPNSKLTAEQVLYVRNTYPLKTAQALATELSVSKKTVLNILHGRIYKDVLEKAEV